MSAGISPEFLALFDEKGREVILASGLTEEEIKNGGPNRTKKKNPLYVRTVLEGTNYSPHICKKEIIERVSKELGVTVATVEPIVTSALNIFKNELARGRPASIIGFGAFDVAVSKARKYADPMNGEIAYRPPRIKMKFKLSKKFKAELEKLIPDWPPTFALKHKVAGNPIPIRHKVALAEYRNVIRPISAEKLAQIVANKKKLLENVSKAIAKRKQVYGAGSESIPVPQINTKVKE